MFASRSRIAMFGLMMAVAAFPACGDDEEEGTTDTDGGGGGAGEEFVLVEATQVTSVIGDQLEVRAFNQKTGELYPETYKADKNGKVTIKRPEGAGLFVVGNGPLSDTWNFHPSRKGQEKFIRVSSAPTASVVPMLAGYTNDPEASPFAGDVVWRNPETGNDESVGCAIIKATDAAQDIRYFANNLPASLVQRGADEGTVPPNAAGTNEGEAGKFFLANLKGGLQTITATIGGEDVGSIEVFITPRKEGNEVDTNPPQKSNVSLGIIRVSPDSTKNPTPADCQ